MQTTSVIGGWLPWNNMDMVRLLHVGVRVDAGSTMASDDWTREEVEATVADYLAMLADELAGQPYVKAEHRRRLIPLLRDRSEQSVEFKHANISAVLIDLGFPYIPGYKPRGNYQRLLREVVADRLTGDRAIQQLAATDATSSSPIPQVPDILKVVTDPPKPLHHASEPGTFGTSLGVNYLEIEARNQALGLAGEQFVLLFEKARLVSVGREALADKIQHVSRAVGDREGFDIRSFEPDGSDRLIEVKTTSVARNSVLRIAQRSAGLSSRADRYHLLPAVRVPSQSPYVYAEGSTIFDMHTRSDQLHCIGGLTPNPALQRIVQQRRCAPQLSGRSARRWGAQKHRW